MVSLVVDCDLEARDSLVLLPCQDGRARMRAYGHECTGSGLHRTGLSSCLLSIFLHAVNCACLLKCSSTGTYEPVNSTH